MKELRIAKRKSCKKFCEEITEAKEAARLHKILSKGQTDNSLNTKENQLGSFSIHTFLNYAEWW